MQSAVLRSLCIGEVASGTYGSFVIWWVVALFLSKPKSTAIAQSSYTSQVVSVWSALVLTFILQFVTHPSPKHRILETIHSVMFWVYQYQVTVTSYDSTQGLARSYWSLNYSLVVHGLITASVQVSMLYHFPSKGIFNTQLCPVCTPTLLRP